MARKILTCLQMKVKTVDVADSKALTNQKPHGSPCGFNVLSDLAHLSQARHRLNPDSSRAVELFGREVLPRFGSGGSAIVG